MFGKLHPRKKFPYASLLILAGVAFVFSLLFKMKEVITAIIVMRIIIQFVGQSVGIIAYHHLHKKEKFPFRMWLYPLPAIIGIFVWTFIFFSVEMAYIQSAFAVIAVGCMLYWLRSYLENKKTD